jgi:hypothetical protein
MATKTKTRLDKVEPLVTKMAFRLALRKARRQPPERFWDTLWAWAPGDATQKYLDLEALTETELALVAGPGFAAYGATLDTYGLQTLELGGAALMVEMGMETYHAWCRRQSPETQG